MRDEGLESSARHRSFIRRTPGGRSRRVLGLSTRPRIVLRMLIVVTLLWASAAAKPLAMPSESPPTRVSRTSATRAEHEHQQRVATAAVLLLVGVACLGAVMLALVVWWGFRVRRLARSRRPEPTVYDELWYLRPNTRQPPDHPDDSDQSRDEM